jgi:hypothetical protein
MRQEGNCECEFERIGKKEGLAHTKVIPGRKLGKILSIKF